MLKDFTVLIIFFVRAKGNFTGYQKVAIAFVMELHPVFWVFHVRAIGSFAVFKVREVQPAFCVFGVIYVGTTFSTFTHVGEVRCMKGIIYLVAGVYRVFAQRLFEVCLVLYFPYIDYAYTLACC